MWFDKFWHVYIPVKKCLQLWWWIYTLPTKLSLCLFETPFPVAYHQPHLITWSPGNHWPAFVVIAYLNFLKFYINGIIQHILISAWLLIIQFFWDSPRLLHLPITYFFVLLSSILLYGYTMIYPFLCWWTVVVSNSFWLLQ